MTRHSWSNPSRFTHKTERQCMNCGVVKVTHHQPGVRCWTTFWRGLDEIGQRTPTCEAVNALEKSA